jgi:hypothetical protein
VQNDDSDDGLESCEFSKEKQLPLPKKRKNLN